MTTVKFNAADHQGHCVYGSEIAHYAGNLFIEDNGHWWLGNNDSDSEALAWELEGCYDCDVEFERGEA